MKTSTLLFLLAFTATNLIAQTCEIDFAGTGQAAVVDSVLIENLGNGEILTLKGNDTLKVTIIPDTSTTGVYVSSSTESALHVYPNPMTDRTDIEFYAAREGNASVAVYDLSGHAVAMEERYVNRGIHRFSLTGLSNGLYLVGINLNGSFSSVKLMSRGNNRGGGMISYVSSNDQVYSDSPGNELKSTESEVDLTCYEGERLKFTGMSGDYSTIVTYIPSESKTITFDFMDCTDADSNHYPVLYIDTQIWMGVNLGTTRFDDGTLIPMVRDTTAWAGLSTPAYCWFRNDSINNKNVYGALYNWFAIDTASNGSKNVCPSGWHVSTNEEWAAMVVYLGGLGVAGGKIKERGTEHWNAPNTGATNETGFTATGSGWLAKGAGEFWDLKKYACFWTSTDYNSENAMYRELDDNNASLNAYSWYKTCGFSVRCVKD